MMKTRAPDRANKIGFVEIEKSTELETSWQKMKYGDRRQISKYQGG